MEQERADYADNDLPPPQPWLREWTIVLLGIGVAVAVAAGLILLSVWTGPRFD